MVSDEALGFRGTDLPRWCGYGRNYMYIVATTDPHGFPQCPMWAEGRTHLAVEREGEFCSPECWQEFHELVNDMGVPIEMNYLALEDQPWYGKHHG